MKKVNIFFRWSGFLRSAAQTFSHKHEYAAVQNALFKRVAQAQSTQTYGIFDLYSYIHVKMNNVTY